MIVWKTLAHSGQTASRAAPATLADQPACHALMGGKELAARLQARRPGLKVVFTSGYANDTTIGGAAFLQKPFSPSRLASLVRDVLPTSQPA
jgi:FixJ family two-component response regulator